LKNKPSFIAGATNPLFLIKTEWSDLVCDIKQQKITSNGKPIKLASSDRTFVNDILLRIKSDPVEEW
jgi:hypothetical protein